MLAQISWAMLSSISSRRTPPCAPAFNPTLTTRNSLTTSSLNTVDASKARSHAGCSRRSACGTTQCGLGRAGIVEFLSSWRDEMTPVCAFMAYRDTSTRSEWDLAVLDDVRLSRLSTFGMPHGAQWSVSWISQSMEVARRSEDDDARHSHELSKHKEWCVCRCEIQGFVGVPGGAALRGTFHELITFPRHPYPIRSSRFLTI